MKIGIAPCVFMRNIKKLYIALFLFAVLGTTALKAQSDKFMLQGGFTYQFITLREKFAPAGARSVLPFYGLSVGMNYVLAHSNDQISLGLNPNLNFSFQFSSLSGTSILAQGPVFLLARYGAGATPYNEQRVGIGAGVGLNYSYLYLSQGLDQVSKGFVNPSAVVELNLKGRSSDYSFRVNWSLYRPTSEVLGTDFELSSAGLSIVYSF